MDTPSLRGLRFYYAPYSRNRMYWETVDLFRKLLLTGVVVFVADSAREQQILKTRALVNHVPIKRRPMHCLKNCELHPSLNYWDAQIHLPRESLKVVLSRA